MNEAQKKKLSEMLVRLTNEQITLKEKKRLFNKSQTELVRRVSNKIDSIALAIKDDNEEVLFDSFDETEVDMLLKDS